MPTESSRGTLHRLTAFSRDPEGGNPAGVWLGPELPAGEAMLQIAAEVGFSETAFVAERGGGRFTVRYYSPEAEVPFCGHATIATGVVLGERHGPGIHHLDTLVGRVPVAVERQPSGFLAALTSVAPRQTPLAGDDLDQLLATFGWRRGVLDPALPPVVAYAGAWHPVLALADRTVLGRMQYDFERLKTLMQARDWTTIQVVWRETPTVIHARNPFPVGGVIEDPATGAAAAALGGYLRDAGLVEAPFRCVVRQGDALGRPSRLEVLVPEAGGIIVRGPAIRIAETVTR